MDFASLSPSVRKRLAKLGIHSPFDLILHLPLRYEDETRVFSIADAPLATQVLVEGKVQSLQLQHKPRKQLVAEVADASGTLFVRLIHFYPSSSQLLAVGNHIRLFGEIRSGFWGSEMVHPRIRLIEKDPKLRQTLSPVYPTIAGLSQSQLTKSINQALAACDLADTLPSSIFEPLGLPDFASSVKLLHSPPAHVSKVLLRDHTHPAWQRLKFDELLAQQLSLRIARTARCVQGAPSIAPAGKMATKLLLDLPFKLTHAQERVLNEIKMDLAQVYPMQRLLQGDVGSGKTVVAALAACQVIEAGYQVALMVPTEVLAEQHFRKLVNWLEPLGIRVTWLVGSLKQQEKKAVWSEVVEGRAQLIVGTHALFQHQVLFDRLGLVIVDEQHRFGVAQRLALHKKGQSPHQLMMSATPIPRTLAMSFYADLDVSVIDTLPLGRKPIVTKLISESRRDEIITRIAAKVVEGRQVYWVCPLIQESEMLQLETAVETHARLTQELQGISVGLIHGRLSVSEKAQVMTAFQKNEIQVLVATTVIEVGVDVSNASLIVIENAERMGLSQLHQLRGRVGRGTYDSICILLYAHPLGETAKARLKVIYENVDGFEIARQDLKIRGPGELIGTKQSGVPMLRFADVETDTDLLETAREIAQQLLLSSHDVALGHLHRWLPGREALLKA